MTPTSQKCFDVDTAAALLASPEINAAVEWWTNQLLVPAEHDAGDANVNAFTSFATHCQWHPLNRRQITEFMDALRIGLTVLCLRGSWKEALKDPNCGSACRTVGTDYGPDRTLHCALDVAGIDSGDLRLPIKTIMWINPGCVEVANGYGAKRTAIYQEAP